MSSAGAGAIEMNQSVSSAYLNRRPTRSAPTQSITKLANSNVLDALTTAAANAVASSNNSNNHNSSILNSNNNQFNHHSQSNHNNSILSVRENNNNINTNSSGNLSSHQFANINNDQIVYCDPKTGEVESRVERAILEAENPLNFNDQEEITLSNNERALWINKEENLGWRGPMPLDQYRLNVDPNPNVIVKKPKEKIKYKQEVHVKYLKPPTPKPSELVIVQEPNRQLPAAPPLIIRQAAPRQPTPEPIIIREAPPYIPEPIRRVVHVPGKLLPAPARKVIVERLPSAPPKPQQVIIERWLKPRIPAPRIIVCKPVDRPQIEYHHHPQCPPGCQPCYECPPGCEPSLMDNSFSHHIHHQPDRNDIVISIFLE